MTEPAAPPTISEKTNQADRPAVSQTTKGISFMGLTLKPTPSRARTVNPSSCPLRRRPPFLLPALQGPSRAHQDSGQDTTTDHISPDGSWLRYRGHLTNISRFVRIHEANLKKQGILPLIFEDPADYDRIEKDDRLSFPPLSDLEPEAPVKDWIFSQSGLTCLFPSAIC